MEKTTLKLEIELSQELAEKMAGLTAMNGEANQSVLAQIFDYKNKPNDLSDLDNSLWYFVKRFSEDSFAHILAQDSCLQGVGNSQRQRKLYMQLLQIKENPI